MKNRYIADSDDDKAHTVNRNIFRTGTPTNFKLGTPKTRIIDKRSDLQD